MLHSYKIENGALKALGQDDASLREAFWIDLVRPTREEETLVESLIGIDVPTREEMREIEPSSRLYSERGTRYMTAAIITRSEYGEPAVEAVTFILHATRLVTVRYDDPPAFDLFCTRAAKADALDSDDGEGVLHSLIDTIIDRLADILERVGDNLDEVAHQIFAQEKGDHTQSYRETMRALGRKGNLISKARESLVSLARLLAYLANEMDNGAAKAKRNGASTPAETDLSETAKTDPHGTVKMMQRDVESLALHADYLGNKVQFVLDAVVGMVSIEQNNVMKIFAVVSVVLMPPTLIGSIYGMNFHVIPELSWEYGYPYALVLMVVAGILPYVYARWKHWL